MSRGDLIKKNIDENTADMDKLLRIDESFDVCRRDITVCGKRCSVYFVDGLVKDDTLQKVMDTFMRLTEFSPSSFDGLKGFSDAIVSFAETSLIGSYENAVTAVLSGIPVMFADGIEGALGIDCRSYPKRSLSEPENDKVLRGSRVGFVETLVMNTALIRRHLRDPALTMSHFHVGKSSKTDVIVCYIDGLADKNYVLKLEKIISGLKVDALVMGAQSLAECIMPRLWFNPFPKIRFTERPDCCAAHLLEGKVIVLTDTSPAAMILPSSIFDFIQEADDFYLPPVIGSYLRFIRCTVFFLTFILSPLWYLLISYPEAIPPWLAFIKLSEEPVMPVIFQLFLLEFAVDGLKLAALNTPSMLSGSFSIIGGLILGDFAVRVGWFVPDTIFYMAFVAIANFSQPSYELGYSFKLLRLMLLFLTGLFKIWGFAAGLLLFFVLICTNKTVGGKSYLYPLIPWNGKAMASLIFRHPKRIDK